MFNRETNSIHCKLYMLFFCYIQRDLYEFFSLLYKKGYHLNIVILVMLIMIVCVIDYLVIVNKYYNVSKSLIQHFHGDIRGSETNKLSKI